MQLQFQGTENQQLLWWLLGAVAMLLAAAGIWRLCQRRWREGVLSLAWAAIPPGLLAIFGGGLGLGGYLAALALEVAGAVGIFYLAVYASLGRGRMTALMVLRCLAILALLAVLFKPAVGWTLGGEGGGKPPLPILVDQSGSMATAEQGGATRYLQATQMLSFQHARLSEHFRPVWYEFAQSPRKLDSLREISNLRPAGEGTDGTDIASAIHRAAADSVRADMPGMLILTDGLHNGPTPVRDAVAEAGVPMYVAGVGASEESASGRPNVQIVSAEAPMEVVQNNVATIGVGVSITRMGYAVSQVELRDEAGTVAAAQALERTDKAVDVQSVKLKWTPPGNPAGDGEEGASYVRRMKIVVPPGPGESVSDDNEADLHVLVTQPRIRVLYVEGSMRPEYKYLRRLLSTDPNVQSMCLVRVQGNKFMVEGGIGGKQLAGLPANEEDFALFDVIILGDLDRTFLTLDQMVRIRKFVNDGGGLLMLGGHNSFGPGGYGGSDIETVLPVIVGQRSQQQESTPMVPQLTAEGEASPVFEGIGGYFYGPGARKPSDSLAHLPELLGCVTVASVKPTASVLAVHPSRKNEAGSLPVLAAMQYGAGRSAAFTADTTWKWCLPLAGLGVESPYQRFWGQLIRHLANVETKRRKASSAVVLRVDRSYLQAGQSAKIVALVHDRAGQATASAQVICKVTSVGGENYEESVPMTPSGQGGLYEAAYRAQKQGAFRLTASAVGGDGSALGEDQVSLRVAPHSAEMDRLARDEHALRAMAEESSGRYEDVARLPELIDSLIDRQKGRTGPAVQAAFLRLYHMPSLFLAFVALLTTEWILRRSWQLH